MSRVEGPDLLIVGTSIDPHVEAVTSRLPAEMTYVRLDVDRYPLDQRLSIKVEDGVCRGYLSTSTTVDVMTPGVLWFRRLGQPGVSSSVADKYKKFCLAESNHALESLLVMALPGAWINSYFSSRRMALKPWQYALAQRCGLRVPAVLISNSQPELAAFVGSRLVVTKTLSAPIVSDTDESREFSFTQVISTADLPTEQELSAAPVQAQDLVEPAFEVRVTSVGGLHHGVKINAASAVSDSGVRDWRPHESELQYEWCDVPTKVADCLTRFLNEADIQFGASDFIVDEAGTWHFLETNPHGAWLWLEERLGDSRISDAFARHLTDLAITTRYSHNENV